MNGLIVLYRMQHQGLSSVQHQRQELQELGQLLQECCSRLIHDGRMLFLLLVNRQLQVMVAIELASEISLPINASYANAQAHDQYKN